MEQLRGVCLSDAVVPYLQERNEAIVALLYDAGLRAGELCALDVNSSCIITTPRNHVN